MEPMTVQFFLPDGSKLIFDTVAVKKYKGLWLPGSTVQESNSEAGVLTIQEFTNPIFLIGQRIFTIFTKIKLSISERPGLRLEALLTGEINFSVNGEKIKLKAGQYRLTDLPLLTALFKNDSSCSIFITHYSAELLDQIGIDVLPSSQPKKMPDGMANLIHELLHNPYEENLRDFYYENSVRELLFFHLTNGKDPVPEKLEDKDIAVIYHADAIIASNLHEHFTIEKLSRLAGTNEFKLKKGFRQLFGMGVFHRLLFRRMEQAKMLLETTYKSIGEIADLAGYDTAAGFIHAFRREFDMTPREWRQQVQSGNEEE
jgi:AraC-like DNA-binding protein